MAFICNVQQDVGVHSGSNWERLYQENERFIESGSAYFSQAFAEALGLVSDIELHDPNRGQLRLAAIASLLDHAIEQYATSIIVDADTGLGDYHDKLLRDSGLNFSGTVTVLEESRAKGFIPATNDFVREFAKIFDEHGYRALMEHYLLKVHKVRDLVSPMPDMTGEGASSAVWQDLGWRLTASFADAMGFGQAIAVLNATAYR